MKPYIHSLSSVVKYGGKVEDYIDIHNYMDSSKAIVADNRHRIFTHNSWFIFIVEDVFGDTLVNSEDKTVSVRDICEDHIKEDFGGFIPTPQDYLENFEFLPWMRLSSEVPPSARGLIEKKGIRKERLDD